MTRPTSSLLLAAFLLSAPARAEEAPPPPDAALAAGWEALDRLHHEAAEGERRLMWGLVGAGLASTAAGAALLAVDGHDGAFRVAGGVTLAFSVIDAALGGMALGGQRAGRAAWAERRARGGDRRALVGEQERFAREQGQEGWVFALNLGLDVGYLMAGAVGAAASGFVVEHPDRWLAGGLAAAAQGLLLVVIDSVGLARARRWQSTALSQLSALALTPVVAAPVGGGGALLGLSGRF